MNVCHISDWHGKLKRLPHSDLYVVTGDMLPNFPLVKIMIDKWRRDGIVTFDPYDPRGGPPPPGHFVDRIIDPQREAVRQSEWCLQRPFRREVGIPDDAPVIVVKGNHDFISLSDWIGGDVWEIDEDPTRTTTIAGVKFGGCRGINYIIGEWSDELSKEEFVARSAQVPKDIDVLVTHSPPEGILDCYPGYHDAEHWGSPALAGWLNSRNYAPVTLKAHLFGHVHEAHSIKKIGGTTFSNAATSINVLHL